MNNNYQHVTFVLDRSGSMNAIWTDALEGFNAFLSALQNSEKKQTFSLVLFDHEYDVRYDFAPVSTVQPLTQTTYMPRGSTALTDAVGQAIVNTGRALKALPESERPGEVVLVIFTDGQENASHRYTRAQVKDMIEHQQNTYDWKVQFLAQNINAEEVGATYGINVASSATMSKRSFTKGMTYLANNVAASNYTFDTSTKADLLDDTTTTAKVK